MENKRKRVLVTGGSRGIGRACVALFAQKGYDCAFLYKSNDEKASALARETGAFAIKADVSDSESVKCAVEKVLDKLGGIDILVNNAGIAQFKLFTDITDEDWRNMIDTNLGGVFYVTRAVLPGMISRKSGAIVNISSMWGQTGASCEVHYSAAKAGIIGLTKALAKEVGLSGITVNCICPGAVDTDMNSTLDEDSINELCDETPLSRLGTAEEIAEAVDFLSSDKARFITGAVLSVNGGLVI